MPADTVTAAINCDIEMTRPAFTRHFRAIDNGLAVGQGKADSPVQMADLIRQLYARGLDEVYVLHAQNEKPVFGQFSFEKGRFTLRDQGLINGMKIRELGQCFDNGLIGMVCDSDDKDWDSLTFYGLRRCNISMDDLSQTRYGALAASENAHGDRLIDFTGSVYRGYQLMLQHHFLPVVLLRQIDSIDGEPGLAVCDLRAVPMSIERIRALNNAVYNAIAKTLTIVVDDETMEQEEFETLFGNYLKDR